MTSPSRPRSPLRRAGPCATSSRRRASLRSWGESRRPRRRPLRRSRSPHLSPPPETPPPLAEARPVPHSVAPLPPVAPPTQASAKDRTQGGWLSNLLAAASRDDADEALSPRGPESLEALTQGIAGLIDNAAASEMWDRHRRGDTAGISRRLYTEAGQQAFDEIRRRYRNDRQFHEAADRYVQEFERLLAKLDQNDRDGSQWLAYLMSNTGKVYTILAHASGRLG